MPAHDTKQGTFIKSNFGTIWPVHVVGFTRLLVQLRKRFDGDLDLALILAVIGSRTQLDHWVPELAELGKLTRQRESDDKQLAINTQSISEYSGIPRETVRRKVTILQERGWITRGANGHLAVAQDAAPDLENATGDTIAYLAALLKAIATAQNEESDNRSC